MADPSPVVSWIARAAREAVKLPIRLYRVTLKGFIGHQCRHLPTCSQYGLDAIETNGAWRGLWLTVARLSRCRPWGTSGYDPPPDIRCEHHGLAPWRYGRWTTIAPSPAAREPADR